MRMQGALAAQADAAPFAGATDPRGFPEDARAVIQCPAPSVMSAGRRRAAEWVLTFEPRARPFIEPLMGWTGSTDTLSQVRLRFPSREAAVAYAQRHGLRYEVREPVHIRRGDLPRARRNLPVVDDPIPPEIGWAWDSPQLAFDRGLALHGIGAEAA